jgi:hypothetical protein
MLLCSTVNSHSNGTGSLENLATCLMELSLIISSVSDRKAPVLVSVMKIDYDEKMFRVTGGRGAKETTCGFSNYTILHQRWVSFCKISHNFRFTSSLDANPIPTVQDTDPEPTTNPYHRQSVLLI